MKALARSYIWWPGMDVEIEECFKKCARCQDVRPLPPSPPFHPWEWPEQPWSRLHLDFAGPFMGHMFLVLIDSYSKWIDVHIMQSITAAKTIEKLRIVFANHGLPRSVVTDNGPSFISEEFKSFLEKNGIQHSTTSLYHPSSNGLAEKAVQIVKHALLSGEKEGSIQEVLSRFLLMYRVTPHSTTGVSPSELLMGRRLRIRLDLCFPNVDKAVHEAQRRQKLYRDNSKQLRVFSSGDKVLVKNFRSTKPRWLEGTVDVKSGEMIYVVELANGVRVRRHIDHVRQRDYLVDTKISDQSEDDDTFVDVSSPSAGDSTRGDPPDTIRDSRLSEPVVRHSFRNRRPPIRYGNPLSF